MIQNVIRKQITRTYFINTTVICQAIINDNIIKFHAWAEPCVNFQYAGTPPLIIHIRRSGNFGDSCIWEWKTKPTHCQAWKGAIPDRTQPGTDARLYLPPYGNWPQPHPSELTYSKHQHIWSWFVLFTENTVNWVTVSLKSDGHLKKKWNGKVYTIDKSTKFARIKFK